MILSLSERLTMLAVPSALYYRHKIAGEALWGEHELYLLDELIQHGGTAIDVGANKGFFAFAFSRIVDRVEAFEPNPDYARFARRMLGGRAQVHEIALSNEVGKAEFVVPLAENGAALHLGGKLSSVDTHQSHSMSFQVQVRTLDSYAFENVRAIKVDVEGSEMEVLEGARQTIAKWRPPLIVELLTGTYSDPIATAEKVCDMFAYTPWLVTKDHEVVEALPVMRGLDSNTTWGSLIRNRNVLFLPRD